MTENDLPSMPLPQAPPNHWQNLLWALGSADITATTALPWLPACRRSALQAFFSTAETETLLGGALGQWLDDSHSRRLGIYFESLWAFAFQHHPDYRLLARNLPIRDAGRTLGELDFVVEHLPDGAVEHWELAVKFYLQVDNHWVGPGLRDRLDIKLARMADHQLPVAHRPEAHTALDALGIRLDRQWALMPGRLFTPLESGTAAEPECWWADTATFLRHFCERPMRSPIKHPVKWLHLPKQSWLAPTFASSVTSLHPVLASDIPAAALRTRLDSRGPLCIAGIRECGEVHRGFLVPDDWRERAITTLPSR